MTIIIYAFLQAGLIGLTKTMAVDEAKYGVRVNWYFITFSTFLYDDGI